MSRASRSRPSVPRPRPIAGAGAVHVARVILVVATTAWPRAGAAYPTLPITGSPSSPEPAPGDGTIPGAPADDTAPATPPSPAPAVPASPAEAAPAEASPSRSGDAEEAPAAASPATPAGPPVATSPPAAAPIASPRPPVAPPLDLADQWKEHPLRFTVVFRRAFRRGDSSEEVTPDRGLSVAGMLDATYLGLRAGGNRVLEGAVGVDFSYDHFSTHEEGAVNIGGVSHNFSNSRVTTETSFLLVHTASLIVGRWRPHVTVGAGLGFGYFDSVSPELEPGSARDTHLLGRVGAGIDLDAGYNGNFRAIARADYTAVRGVAPFVTTAGRSLSLFGDLLDIGVGVALRF